MPTNGAAAQPLDVNRPGGAVLMSAPLAVSTCDTDRGELRAVMQGRSLLIVYGTVDGAGGVDEIWARSLSAGSRLSASTSSGSIATILFARFALPTCSLDRTMLQSAVARPHVNGTSDRGRAPQCGEAVDFDARFHRSSGSARCSVDGVSCSKNCRTWAMPGRDGTEVFDGRIDRPVGVLE